MRAPALAGADLYVAAAYFLFLALVVVYVVIIRTRFARATTQAEVLARLLRGDDGR
jgi:hypothetical protein